MLPIKTLALVDPDIFILKGLKHLALVTKEVLKPLTISIEGFPILAISIGLGVVFITGKIIEYKLKNNPMFKTKLQSVLSSGGFTKIVLIAGGVLSVIIFTI